MSLTLRIIDIRLKRLQFRDNVEIRGQVKCIVRSSFHAKGYGLEIKLFQSAASFPDQGHSPMEKAWQCQQTWPLPSRKRCTSWLLLTGLKGWVRSVSVSPYASGEVPAKAWTTAAFS